MHGKEIFKMKTKILKISEVIIDFSIYPREEYSAKTSLRYAKAMKMGEEFPPIVVNEKNILIDGRHRLEARKYNKEKFITAEVLSCPDKKSIYVEAVRRNISHGRPFLEREITEITITLKDFQLSKEEISKIVRLPACELTPFRAKKMERITDKISKVRDNFRQEVTYTNEKDEDIVDKFLIDLASFKQACLTFNILAEDILEDLPEKDLIKLKNPTKETLDEILPALRYCLRFLRLKEDLQEAKREIEKIVYEKPDEKLNPEKELERLGISDGEV